MHERLFKPNS
jgi:hypothetical protein